MLIQIWHQVLLFHQPYAAGLLSEAVQTSVFITSSPFKDPQSLRNKYSQDTGWKNDNLIQTLEEFSSFSYICWNKMR